MTKKELAIKAFKNQLGLILEIYPDVRDMLYENEESIMFHDDINGKLTLKFLPSGKTKVECFLQTSPGFEIFDVDVDFNVCEERYKSHEGYAKSLIVNAMLEWDNCQDIIKKVFDNYRSLKYLAEEE